MVQNGLPGYGVVANGSASSPIVYRYVAEPKATLAGAPETTRDP